MVDYYFRNPLRRLKRQLVGFLQRLAHWRYRTKTRARHLLRAWRYARHRLTADDAQWIMLECEHPAGWYPLLILTVEDTLKQARESFADHPDLRRLIADGCARVSDKWESRNDDLHNARCWAIDVAKRYAHEEGTVLIPLNEND